MHTNESICNALDKICGHICDCVHRINRGGCGIFALELAKILERYGVFNYKIRVWSHDDPVDVSEVEKTLIAQEGCVPNDADLWNANNVYFNHIRLEFDGFFWDAVDGPVDRVDGYNYEYAYYLLDGELSLEALEAIVETEDNWNSEFNRAQIPTMRAYIEDVFRRTLTD
jgi:hypothetical protein